MVKQFKKNSLDSIAEDINIGFKNLNEHLDVLSNKLDRFESLVNYFNH